MVDRLLQAPEVCELVVVVSLEVVLKVRGDAVEFLEVVCMDLVVGVIKLVVAAGGSVLYYLLQGCIGVGCELSHLCLDWLGYNLTLVELILPW